MMAMTMMRYTTAVVVFVTTIIFVGITTTAAAIEKKTPLRKSSARGLVSKYVQHGCTSYYNTGYAFRPPNTEHDGDQFDPDICHNACRDKGYSYFGFECPMTNDVHCQCYTTSESIGPMEDANCKERVGNDGDKHCTGPAMMMGMSLGGADMGSIYEVNPVGGTGNEGSTHAPSSESTSQHSEFNSEFSTHPHSESNSELSTLHHSDFHTEGDCVEIPPEPIWKETIGNVDEYPYVEDAIQITSQGSDSITFTVSQIWFKEGAPMIAVHYDGGDDGEEFCNMNAPSDGGLVEFGFTQEYTANCLHGFTDIGVYFFAGKLDGFDVEGCESCSATNMDYVGHYLTLPCVSLCEEPIDPATEIPSEATSTGAPTGIAPCPEDVTLLRKIGSTQFPVDKAVEIVSQDTKTVTVKLNQAWTSTTAIDQIYASYKDSLFDRNCFETDNIEEGLYDTVTITCNIMSPKAYLEICVVDDLDHDVLSEDDKATIPKCCHPELTPDTPIVCYSLEINCVSECMDVTQQRKLKLVSSLSPSPSLRARTLD